MSRLTHIDAQGNAIMVDVGGKEQTERRAVATGRIKMSAECYQEVCSGSLPKGDVFGAARVAGIMAVKQTAFLIPLCHTLPIEQATLDFDFDDQEYCLIATCMVKTTGVTGVEMEALTGVSVALLTIYDMCKALDKSMELDNIYLVEKTGGQSGSYLRVSQNAP